MDKTTVHHQLRPDEEAFLLALLWEESHLQRGPATRAASEHGLSILRCFEVANRLSPDLQGHALAQIYDIPCPTAEWPWPGLMGADVLQLLWGRLSSKNKDQTFTPKSNPCLSD